MAALYQPPVNHSRIDWSHFSNHVCDPISMTVICPNCDARFRDPPAEIAMTRPMQCSKCEHEFIRPEGLRLLKLMKVDAPSLVPDMRSLINNRDDAIITNLPVVVEGKVQEEDTSPIRTFVDRAPDMPPKSSFPKMPIAALMCLGIAAGAIAFKDIVIDHVPQAHSAYSIAGLTSPAPELELSSVKTSKLEKDGIRRLIIRGEIENTAAHKVPVPPIKLTMRGDKKISLYAWTVSAAKDQLKAGERSRFTAIAHDYPGDAVDVEVEFAPVKETDNK